MIKSESESFRTGLLSISNGIFQNLEVMKKIWILIILIAGCNSKSCDTNKLVGTLGTFQRWEFTTASEVQMNKAIMDLYMQNPQYLIPEKWKYLDSWEKSGYGSLNGKIFYFEEGPNEMYYVSYYEENIDGHDAVAISVRAVNNADGSTRWETVERFREPEQKRINTRFHEEIIKKLEKLLNVKAGEYNP